MRISLVIPTLFAGGAERVLSILANQWASDGHEVDVILLAQGPSFYTLSPDVTLTELGFVANSSGWRRIKSLLTTSLRLRQLISERQPDFVLSFMNKYNVFVLMSLVFLKPPVFVSERDSPDEQLPLLTTIARKLIYPLATGVICQTEPSRQFVQQHLGCQNVIALPNPISKVCSKKYQNRKPIILSVGRLVPKKGHQFLIEAFSLLEDESWSLIILGGGPLKDDLTAHIRQKNLAHRITIEPPTKDVSAYYNSASIFAFPSLMEGFPNALAEAMAHGLPCVSFDCSTGPSDLITDSENGFLVPVGDVNLMSSRLHELIKNPSLRESISLKSKVVSAKLSSETICSAYLKFCSSHSR